LINSQTGARFELPKRNRGEASAFAKDGSTFFTLAEGDDEGDATEIGHWLLSFYKIKSSGIQLINSLPLDDRMAQPVWLGNDRLLYLKRDALENERPSHRKRLDLGLLYERGELWVVDIATGQQRPFFAGNDSVTKD
jgi:hypothetical protein